MNFYVAKLLATAVTLIWNFAANYLYTFAKAQALQTPFSPVLVANEDEKSRDRRKRRAREGVEVFARHKTFPSKSSLYK
jgi:hypothetical protein